MTWVILLGEIDLSVGSIITVTGMVGASSIGHWIWIYPRFIDHTHFAGALLGFINGALTAKLALPSFIVTVATMEFTAEWSVCRPTALLKWLQNDNWTAIGNETWLGIPVVIWILFVLFLINHIVLARTVLQASVFNRRKYWSCDNIRESKR